MGDIERTNTPYFPWRNQWRELLKIYEENIFKCYVRCVYNKYSFVRTLILSFGSFVQLGFLDSYQFLFFNLI